MSNVINFSNLKRKELKCLVFEDYKKGSIEVAYNNLDDLKNKIEAPIEIYNPSQEQKVEILEMLKNNVKDNGESELDGFTIIKTIFPMLTNIQLDLDDESIKNIIEDPSEILLTTQNEIGKIIYSLTERFKNNLEVLQRLSQEEQDIIMKQYKEEEENVIEELTEEEIAIIEKAKKLGKI